jgi:SAM-dependent methyltransferase
VPEAVSEELVTMWALNDSQAFALRSKESLVCPWCGSKHRARRLAHTFLNTIDPSAVRFSSLKSFSMEAGRCGLGGPILILNRIDGIEATLRNCSNVVLTDYVEGAVPGTIVDGIRHEDAQNLTFPDSTFSFVISSETLEHIPNLHQALREIRRVLQPGGFHLFTIPQKPGTPETFARMMIDSEGKMIDLVKPRIHHPGGAWGWPVFTEFGDDFSHLLRQNGWRVTKDDSESEDSKALGIPCVCVVYSTSPDSSPELVPLAELTSSLQ